MLKNLDATPSSNFQPIRLCDSDCWCKYTYLMTNNAAQDQWRSQLIWIYTVCKYRAYLGWEGPGLKIAANKCSFRQIEYSECFCQICLWQNIGPCFLLFVYPSINICIHPWVQACFWISITSTINIPVIHLFPNRTQTMFPHSMTIYWGSYTSGHFIWNLWNEPLASFINFVLNDHECKILFIIWPF